MNPMRFPIDRRLPILSGLAWALGAVAALVAVSVFLVPSLLVALLVLAFVVLIPAALAGYAVAGAAGRRALFDLAPEFRGSRPSDDQMRRYLRDEDPWWMFALHSVITSAIITACAVITVIGVATSGAEAAPLLTSVTVTVVFAIAIVAASILLRRCAARGVDQAAARDRLWPLPASSELLADLRSTGGDTGMNGPL